MDVAAELERSGHSTSGWLSGELNNARLVSMTLYEGRLPSFRALYAKCQNDIPCFYAATKKLAAMESGEREGALLSRDLLQVGRGRNE